MPVAARHNTVYNDSRPVGVSRCPLTKPLPRRLSARWSATMASSRNALVRRQRASRFRPPMIKSSLWTTITPPPLRPLATTRNPGNSRRYVACRGLFSPIIDDEATKPCKWSALQRLRLSLDGYSALGSEARSPTKRLPLVILGSGRVPWCAPSLFFSPWRGPFGASSAALATLSWLLTGRFDRPSTFPLTALVGSSESGLPPV